ERVHRVLLGLVLRGALDRQLALELLLGDLRVELAERNRGVHPALRLTRAVLADGTLLIGPGGPVEGVELVVLDRLTLAERLRDRLVGGQTREREPAVLHG